MGAGLGLIALASLGVVVLVVVAATVAALRDRRREVRGTGPTPTDAAGDESGQDTGSRT